MWNASGVLTKEGEIESKKVKRKEAKNSAKVSKKMKSMDVISCIATAKFFQLLDSCLKTIPPSGGLVIVALVHNLLQRHRSINYLVHQEDNVETAKDVSSIKSGINQFKNDATDLLKTVTVTLGNFCKEFSVGN
nr:nucleolar complex protein 4 homolog [Tanacetum cinerariifolium]